ncbi:MAG: signal peptide peptidase SppA [Tannerella sp.]|nr:signal peptide peptidase SppA [Tannerella sp.]
MKQFFKIMFASMFGVLLAMLLLTFIGSSFLVAMLLSLGSESNMPYTPKYDESVFTLNLNGLVYEEVDNNPLTMLMSENTALSMKDILSSIKSAKEHNTIKGIYLDMGLFLTGTANIDAIRRELLDFKESGKFVVAYADNYTQAGYYLASVADEVYLNPLGTLSLTGFSSETMFYKGLFQKVGVEMMVFKVGKYKGAVEPFIGDHLSEENREQITSYQQGIWDNVTNGIATSRGITSLEINRFADEGLFMSDPTKAIESGLIDGLKYRTEVEKVVMEKAKQKSVTMKSLDISKMKRAKKQERVYRNKIAVLYAEGTITPSALSYASESITEKLTDELIKLQDDENVKAVVLRVNSPGGSAFVSEQIWKQVVELKKIKPVVVSMGNVAASGGYYISCGASKIVAEPTTLTGSIGIFGIFPNASGLFEKIALTTDVVKTNNFADLGDLSRPMTQEEQALIQSSIERGYEIFLSRCAEGRKMSVEAVDSIAQGHVWTGSQAYQLGLVDELGGIDKAIELAVDLSGIINYTIIDVSTSTDMFKSFLEKRIEESKESMLKDLIGDEYEYFRTLRQVKSTYGIQARIPYDFNPL